MNNEVKDYFSSPEECLNQTNQRTQTNPRYKNFTQDHFTAGDEEQFYTFIQKRNSVKTENKGLKNINVDNNIFKFHSIEKYEHYKGVGVEGVDNTFRYLFHKLKKGIYIKIENNELVTFLPFSNANFRNEWSHMIKHDPLKYNSICSFIEHICKLEGRHFNKFKINKDISAWYANNCLIRYEYPICEGDTNVGAIRDMFINLCKERHVPDIEFFINKRDFPVLKKNGTEPYNHIWNSTDKKLVSHLYDTYSPILSMCSDENEFADILMPTHEDWVRISTLENKYFAKALRPYNTEFNMKWEDKKPIAVFRGSSTGAGVTIETNLRLKISYLSSLNKKDIDNVPFLDAGITNWCLRPRKLYGKDYLETIDVENLPFKTVNKLTPLEQSSYKYIIHIDGHVSAFRLSFELSMGSVLLIPKSQWSIWFFKYLQPYVHYVPLDSELNNIYEQIKWCKDNDEECNQIAQNAKQFYTRYLCRDGILDFLQKTLIETHKLIGFTFYNKYGLYDFWNSIQQNANETQYKIVSNNKVIKPNFNMFESEQKHTFGFCFLIDSLLTDEDINSGIKTSFEPIFSSNRTNLSVIDFNGYKLCVKQPKNKTDEDIREKQHEYFVGRKINELLKTIPNFRYTFDNKNLITTEYIEGKTFFEYLGSQDFNMLTYLDILVQISLALHVAQDSCVFIHKDLAPWNIVLLENKSGIKYDYCLNTNIIYTVDMKYVPVIIDYGRSHICVNNIHFENGNMSDRRINNILNPNATIDIVSILLTSIDVIIKVQFSNKTLGRNDIQQLINLVNFISKTNLLKDPVTNLYEIRTFVSHYKKYGVLMSSDLSDIRDFTPLELVKHIYTHVDGRVHVMQKEKQIVSATVQQMIDCFPVQIFLYSISQTKENRRRSFEFYNFISITNETDPNNIFKLYEQLKLWNIIQWNKIFYLKFLDQYYSQTEKINYIDLYDKQARRYLFLTGNEYNFNSDITNNVNELLSMICLPIFYTINDYTFELNVKTIQPVITQLKNKKYNIRTFQDICDFLDIVEYVSIFYTTDKKSEEVNKQIKEFLRFRPFAIKQFFASCNTILLYLNECKKKNIPILGEIKRHCTNNDIITEIQKEIEAYDYL